MRLKSDFAEDIVGDSFVKAQIYTFEAVPQGAAKTLLCKSIYLSFSGP